MDTDLSFRTANWKRGHTLETGVTYFFSTKRSAVKNVNLTICEHSIARKRPFARRLAIAKLGRLCELGVVKEDEPDYVGSNGFKYGTGLGTRVLMGLFSIIEDQTSIGLEILYHLDQTLEANLFGIGKYGSVRLDDHLQWLSKCNALGSVQRAINEEGTADGQESKSNDETRIFHSDCEIQMVARQCQSDLDLPPNLSPPDVTSLFESACCQFDPGSSHQFFMPPVQTRRIRCRINGTKGR